MKENLKDQMIYVIKSINKKRKIVIHLPFKKMNIVQIFMRTALHILTQRLSSLLLLTEIISPSATGSPDVARFNVEDTMKFMMEIQKLPRLIAVAIKKNP